MLIERALIKELSQKLKTDRKVLLLYGPRQVGKTTLVQTLIRKTPFKTLSINADQGKFIDILSSRDLNQLQSLVSGYELLFIDEAQRIPEIGLNLKILADHLPKLKIIATGSSSFDLAGKVREPLTGRSWSYTLYPISFLELKKELNPFELKTQLEERLIYGSYPELFSLQGHRDKKGYLEALTQSYLYKDVLELATIRNANKLRDLLKLLAFQVGHEVSMDELAGSLGISKGTVEHYIDLLEQSFVLFRLTGFSRNLRKEVTKMPKIYFYDLGVRNIVIDNLKLLKDRNDTGQLWENFLIMERRKRMAYRRTSLTPYFWRTYTGAELDYIEEREGKLFGYEFKWGVKKVSAPKSWLATYKNATFECVHPDNFLKFIS